MMRFVCTLYSCLLVIAAVAQPAGKVFTAADYISFADSCSARNDSVNASVYVSKIDPYFVEYLGYLPQTIHKFLSRFRLTQAARDAYRAQYDSFYNTPRTADFIRFKNYHTEDQQLRTRYDSATSIASCEALLHEMRISDSIHFAYLYSYVQKYGWPEPRNGGMYALIAAIHDHARHNLYLKAIDDGIKKGMPLQSARQLIDYWLQHEISLEYLRVRLSATKSKYSFDVSSMLNGSLPANMNEIEAAVKRTCPAKWYLVYYGKLAFDGDAWCTLEKINARLENRPHILESFINSFVPYCPKDYHEGFWHIYYMQATGKPRIMFYVLYGDSKN